MISLVELLNEIKASKYVDIIENLLLKINWNQFQEFQSIQDNALSIIDDIKNIHNEDLINQLNF